MKGAEFGLLVLLMVITCIKASVVNPQKAFTPACSLLKSHAHTKELIA